MDNQRQIEILTAEARRIADELERLERTSDALHMGKALHHMRQVRGRVEDAQMEELMVLLRRIDPQRAIKRPRLPPRFQLPGGDTWSGHGMVPRAFRQFRADEPDTAFPAFPNPEFSAATAEIHELDEDC